MSLCMHTTSLNSWKAHYSTSSRSCLFKKLFANINFGPGLPWAQPHAFNTYNNIIGNSHWTSLAGWGICVATWPRTLQWEILCPPPSISLHLMKCYHKTMGCTHTPIAKCITEGCSLPMLFTACTNQSGLPGMRTRRCICDTCTVNSM